MQSLIQTCFAVFVLLCVVGDGHFIPPKDKVHLGRLGNGRRWGRWCLQDIECGRGFCRAYSCQCHPGYITWRLMQVCSYEQRSKVTAFLLSFFTGIFGTDWFVLSRGDPNYIIAGIMKLMISLGCIIGWPTAIAGLSKNQKTTRNTAKTISIVLTAIALVWWLIDWIRILADGFRDGHGAPLQPWVYNYYDSISYYV